MTLASLCCEYMFAEVTHTTLAASFNKIFASQQYILFHGCKIDKLS